MKVDFAKAYDFVDWDFSMTVLHFMNFPLQFCAWIRACVTNPKISVKISSEFNGFFSSRGLHQGVLLLPYLSILIMQILQGNVRYHTEADEIQYC